MAQVERRIDPLRRLKSSGEPAEDLGMTQTVPSILTRRPPAKERRTPVRPSEKRRRKRKLTVTFSTPDMPQRLRTLANRWGFVGPDGQRPNVSALVEYLLTSQVEAAEAGVVKPPD